MNPTQEEQRKFWKGLGVNLKHEWTDEIAGYKTSEAFCKRCGNSSWPPEKSSCYPPIDLNNLFKYATDKVREKIGEKEYFKLLVRWCQKLAMGEDPVDSLFDLLFAQIML